jgi:hypothetical protein
MSTTDVPFVSVFLPIETGAFHLIDYNGLNT